MNPQMLQNLMSNPIGTILAAGFNLPPNQQFNGPKDIVMYLVNSGQVSQQSLNQGQQMAQQYGYKL